MFIGRRKELQSLEDLYARPGFSMTIITGRRRIGKSTLIREFIKDKYAVFYTASKVGSARNLELLSEQVVNVLEPSISGVSFGSTQKLFDFITQRLSDRKLILALDEIPYWAQKDEALFSILQQYIDNDWHDKNLMIILCGSSLSFMEDEVLSEKSPLYGRRDSQIHLKEFDYIEAAEFVPDYSFEDKAICYGITGGVAKYLSLINPREDIDTNISRLFFSTNGYLYDEPHNLLVQEFSDIAVINNIIEQIAGGENTLNLIAGRLHENPGTVLYSLKRLIAVGLVERRLCMGEEKNKKKVQYVLVDNMFRFWYRFVPDAISAIELGEGNTFYNRAVKPQIHDYMARVFEGMCQYYVLRAGVSGKSEYYITRTGSWWGTERISLKDGSKRTQTADIDVVGISDTDHVMVTGECKFRNEPADKTVYETLIRRSKAIPVSYPVKKYLIFSLTGFTNWYKENRDAMLELHTLEDLYEDPAAGNHDV